VLWQIPVGHFNGSNASSAYTGSVFPNLDNTSTHYEDSACDFFLGDSKTISDTVRLNYFDNNLWGDTKIARAGTALTWGNHLQECKDAGIISVLFGAGVNASTDGVGSPPTDNYFWIQKVQKYYNAGVVPLAAYPGEMPNCTLSCPPQIRLINPTCSDTLQHSELCSIALKIHLNDPNGNILSSNASINGVPVSTSMYGSFMIINYLPSSFGTHNITINCTDNEGLSSTLTCTFIVQDFNASACGYAEWAPTTTYSTAGSLVAYNGIIYRNKWWTAGDMPSMGESWSPWEINNLCAGMLNEHGALTIVASQNGGCIGDTVTYSVPLVAGATYVWTVTGGIIVSGAGTNTISVQWTSGTATSVSVTVL
jgi:chitodextrinase